ncbi:Uncharacterised protein [Legionella wadsworthii]|uniref:DUF1269 domain-containing protein n=1 Tax=Legionella wadsworthii TaxID=28088 RepID=A0A378LT74_9GAMM|nr:hypothetical protein [Legionella wadsworthii]STY29042.1 Uncharacterised protein [Legionella wadsworthii]
MGSQKIIEIFPNIQSAERAYQYALDCGYTPNDITVIMGENYDESKLIEHEKIKTLEDVGKGGASGGSIGGLIGLILSLGGSVIVPGIGLIIAGPLAGLVVGTLMGTLLALGVSESQASEYEEAIQSGKVILCMDGLNDSDIQKKWSEISQNNAT